MPALGRPRSLVVAAVLAACAGGAAWAFLGSGRSPAPDADPAADSLAGAAVDDATRPDLAVALRGPERPEAPAAPDGPLSLTAARLGLTKGTWDVRERTLITLKYRGCELQEIVADLERVQTGGIGGIGVG